MIYSVKLATCGNIDHNENPHAPMCGVPEKLIYTASIEECQRRVLEYIDKYDIGASNWKGGEVYDGLGRLVGRISYNGCFWERRRLHS